MGAVARIGTLAPSIDRMRPSASFPIRQYDTEGPPGPELSTKGPQGHQKGPRLHIRFHSCPYMQTVMPCRTLNGHHLPPCHTFFLRKTPAQTACLPPKGHPFCRAAAPFVLKYKTPIKRAHVGTQYTSNSQTPLPQNRAPDPLTGSLATRPAQTTAQAQPYAVPRHHTCSKLLRHLQLPRPVHKQGLPEVWAAMTTRSRHEKRSIRCIFSSIIKMQKYPKNFGRASPASLPFNN